jgi:hypothetical protein
MNRLPLSRGALLAAAVLLVAACAGRRDVPSPFDENGRGSEPVLLTVDNQDFRDATIFIDWNGVRHRLGSVTGKTKQTFRMEWRDMTMRIEVDFLGGGEMKLSDEISVWPGEHIEFFIMAGW